MWLASILTPTTRRPYANANWSRHGLVDVSWKKFCCSSRRSILTRSSAARTLDPCHSTQCCRLAKAIGGVCGTARARPTGMDRMAWRSGKSIGIMSVWAYSLPRPQVYRKTQLPNPYRTLMHAPLGGSAAERPCALRPNQGQSRLVEPCVLLEIMHSDRAT